MFKKIKNTFFITSFLIFSILVSKYYFSEENIIKTNKSRSLYLFNLNRENINIPFLKNDTNDVVEYIDEAENFIKKKKNFTFWNLLKKKNDE